MGLTSAWVETSGDPTVASYAAIMFDRIRRYLSPPEPELTVLLPDPLAGQVRELMGQHKRVEAVRLTRKRTGLNLLPAVRAVDALDDGRT